MTNDKKRAQVIRVCFYTLWLVLAVTQACTTELLEDEAYYWVFGNNLDWGYYENSPAIAAMIKFGYSLIPNELGVRLITILFITTYLYLLERLVKPKNLILYYMSISSIAVLHLLSILSVPDTPLLFFGICFFHTYKRYLNKDSLLNSVLLALNIALLLFSKYHGILLIAFTVASNPALFKRRSFWLTAVLALAFFSPHIIWQFQNDFPTIKFNLTERFNRGGYKPEYTLIYSASIPLLLAPITGTVLLFLSFKQKPKDLFEKALKYVVVGILVFFGVMTFRGHGEGNWTLSTLAPAVVLGYKYAEDKQWYRNFAKYSFVISIILIGAVRIYFANDIFGVDKYLLRKVHGWPEWAQTIKAKADGRPVVFMNTYQHASQYLFYSKEPLATSLNNRMSKRNQYNLWHYEDSLQDKDVMLIANYHVNGLDSIKTPLGYLEYLYINNFHSASHVNLYDTPKELTANASDSMVIKFKLGKDKDFITNLDANPDYPATLTIKFFDNKKVVHEVFTDFRVTNSMLDSSTIYELPIQMPAVKGSFYMYIDLSVGWIPPAINSSKTDVTIQ